MFAFLSLSLSLKKIYLCFCDCLEKKYSKPKLNCKTKLKSTVGEKEKIRIEVGFLQGDDKTLQTMKRQNKRRRRRKRKPDKKIKKIVRC